MHDTTIHPRASAAIRAGHLDAPPPLTPADIDAWSRTLAGEGRHLIAVSDAMRYAGDADSPPLLFSGEVLAELVDEWNPRTGDARIGAEHDGHWFRVAGGTAADGPVYLTWCREGGVWRVTPCVQYEA